MTGPRLAWMLIATCILLVGPPHRAQSQSTRPPSVDAALDRVFELQQKLQDLHPAFERLFPVAVVRDKTFYVYEPDPGTRHYKLAATSPDKMNVPVGIRAAMPLDFWNNRIACVVTPEAFDNIRGFILVFHEFVHCYQWETCEMKLKTAMPLFKRAMERKDYMWELEHAFPYASDGFTQSYSAMLKAASSNELAAVTAERKRLKETLSSDDWDYMTWEEWKEGLARYLENEASARLSQAANRGGATPPFSRVAFYAGGEALIRTLSKQQPGIQKDIERLYHAIAER